MQRITDSLSKAAFVCAIAFLAALIPAKSMGQNAAVTDSYVANDRPPDARFKADILVVVAHPDDEVLVTAYLAREVLDNHKRVAVVYGTRGDGGNNEIGPEQALAMGQIRELEARRALGTLGISNVWFLTGKDTASQNVLNSLDHWGHGSNLDQLVRIVRLTRPSIILTFLPDFTTGENHGDHQAAGVLATEAFDLAGDTSAFAEQISPVMNPDGNMNLTEGLRPWQPQKLYYFHNSTYDIFTSRGPQYRSDEISPSRRVSYGLLAAEAFTQHRTQGGDQVRKELDDHSPDNLKGGHLELATAPVKFIFGKSLVTSGITDDIFAGIDPEGIPFHRVSPSEVTPPSTARLSIGDPWNYYRQFWHAHGVDHLASIVPLEITVKVGGTLMIPLIIDNPLEKSLEVNLSVQAPDGWQAKAAGAISVAPRSKYFLRVQAMAPATKLDGWQEFVISGKSADLDLGSVTVRAELSTGWVAAQ